MIDTHDGLYWLAAAFGALFVALVVSAASGDISDTDKPPAPAVYQHPEGP